MRQRICKILKVVLLVTSSLLFLGGETHAVNYPVLGFDVEHAWYPISKGEASYVYSFQATGSNSISNIDLAIPSYILNLDNTSNFTVMYGTLDSDPNNITTPASYELSPPCVGDSGTKFGTGDCRYWVAKVNSTSRNFPLKFYIKFTIKGQNPPNTVNGASQYLGFSQQEMLIKSGNGSVWESKAISGPAFVPKAPTVNFETNRSVINYPDTSATLTWSTTDAQWVFLSPGGKVGVSGSEVVSPDINTEYVITALGDGGSAEKTIVITLGTLPPPPIPSIELSRETIEKRDDLGVIKGYSTTYYNKGVLICALQTGIGVPIPDDPCSNNQYCNRENPSLTPDCDFATNTNLSPILACIPFPGWQGGKDNLDGKCVGGGGIREPNCFAVDLKCKTTGGGIYDCPALCKVIKTITHSSTEQVGNNSCCLKKEPCDTGGTGGYCYTKVPCAGTSTCP